MSADGSNCSSTAGLLNGPSCVRSPTKEASKRPGGARQEAPAAGQQQQEEEEEESECTHSIPARERDHGAASPRSVPEAVPGAVIEWPGEGAVITDADHYLDDLLPMGPKARRPPRRQEGPQPGAAAAQREDGGLHEAGGSGGSAHGEDAVTPFRLDDDFDYDNCKLTRRPLP
mmetsp:Transcript_22482/g.53791  ORF Transcript_22482/g.53791 Transcript_22482/m.53791 type:complete len:173 (+) Transcript_22482:313-831(+)